jgi:hypothetical protein
VLRDTGSAPSGNPCSGNAAEFRAGRAVNVLVGLALDDLECGNLDVETALRFVAHRAWIAGLRDARNASGGGNAQLGDEGV